jgi:hypothetical protein
MDHGSPISYLALEPGAAVVSSDGTEIGTVEHVLADEKSDIFDGLVIKLGSGDLHFADAPEVGQLYERAAVLKISAAEAEQLPKPSASPAVMESHGVEDSESPLRGKLRRAWDRISGNY